jgi:hypothetical protein
VRVNEVSYGMGGCRGLVEAAREVPETCTHSVAFTHGLAVFAVFENFSSVRERTPRTAKRKCDKVQYIHTCTYLLTYRQMLYSSIKGSGFAGRATIIPDED